MWHDSAGTIISGLFRSTEGDVSVSILELTQGDLAHFITLTHWQNIETHQTIRRRRCREIEMLPRRQGLFGRA
jgi:hypothetical protein